MSRNPSSIGGWFKVWGKKSLESQSLISLGDEIEVTWYRVLMAANCVSWKTGRFEWINERIPLSLEQISIKARSKVQNVSRLVEEGMIQQGKDKVYFVPNWAEYQHPKANAELKDEFYGKIKEPKKRTKKGKKGNTGEDKDLTPFEPVGSAHSDFMNWFHTEFLNKTGQKPKINGRDGKALQELLTLYEPQILKNLCSSGWTHKSDFIKAKCTTIHGFADVINQLITNGIPNSLEDKYAHLTEKVEQQPIDIDF